MNNETDTTEYAVEREWDFYALPKKALWKMRTRALMNSLSLPLLLSLVLAVLTFVLEIQLPYVNEAMIAIGALWLVTLLGYWFATALEYSYTAYHLDDEGLVIRKGMLWRKETFVLRSRVQHIDVAQSPLERIFSLASIKVYTAGTKLGSISLSGLDKEDAEYIRDELISKVSDTL